MGHIFKWGGSQGRLLESDEWGCTGICQTDDMVNWEVESKAGQPILRVKDACSKLSWPFSSNFSPLPVLPGTHNMAGTVWPAQKENYHFFCCETTLLLINFQIKFSFFQKLLILYTPIELADFWEITQIALKP